MIQDIYTLVFYSILYVYTIFIVLKYIQNIYNSHREKIIDDIKQGLDNYIRIYIDDYYKKNNKKNVHMNKDYVESYKFSHEIFDIKDRLYILENNYLQKDSYEREIYDICDRIHTIEDQITNLINNITQMNLK